MNIDTIKSCLLAGVMLWAGSLGMKAQHEEGDETFQFRAGATFSTLSGDDDAKMKVNVCYGVEYEHFFNDQFSLAAGVLFTDQGCKYEEDGIETTMNLYYSTFPITANYYVLPGLAVKAGIQPAYRVKARMEQNDEKIDFDRALDVIYDDAAVKMNKFDLAIPIGLSYEFKGVTLDARYNFGVTKLLSGIDESVFNRGVAVTLGYKF